MPDALLWSSSLESHIDIGTSLSMYEDSCMVLKKEIPSIT